MSHPVSGISVVIPNYNGRYLLEEIVPPLMEALQNALLPFEVIVSDDKSTDDSISFLQSVYPQVNVIAHETNRGFAPTINSGIFAAKHSHLLLLNSDVKITPAFFSGLIRYFDKEDTFGVMTRIVGWDNDTIQDGGKYPYFHGVKIKTSGNYIPVDEKKDQWLYSMYLSGANAFVDREKIIQLAAFNEMFAPFYVEDYEVSVRAWRFGWKCYYEHGTVCRHKESVTIKTKAKKNQVNKIYYRNKMYLHALHLPPGLLALWHIQLFFECLFNLILFRLYFVQSVIQYLYHLPKVFSKRTAFKKLAKQSRKKLLSLKEVTEVVLKNINSAGFTRLK
ncbi:MAG TPA: glycosyltransferase family 2 protein [Chitinophagaceae bacterium]|nr:glycosyltransferase family 2 protein [Chitinophagaceae bacterium]